MKKIIGILCGLCLLLGGLSLPIAAQTWETREYEGQTYTNVNTKEAFTAMVEYAFENRLDSVNVYYIEGEEEWDRSFTNDSRNFTGIQTKAVFDYWTYSANTVCITPWVQRDGTVFGTIDVQYLDDKAELEKADAIIDGILQKIASYELYDKLLYIADYVCNATQYGSQELPGGGYDAINGAYDVLTGVRTNTVCTSYALAFQRFMERADIDSYLLSNNYHVWNIVLVDGLWYGIDCTSDAGNKIDRSSFLMGSQSMARYPTDQLDPVSVFAKEHKISKTDYQKNAPATNATQRTTKATKKPVASTTVVSVIESTTTATATTTTVTETSTASTTTTLALPISVQVDIAHDTTVKANAFETAILANVPLELAGDGYSWSFNGTTLDEEKAPESFDAAILVGEQVSEADQTAIQNAAGATPVYPFRFAHHGELPGPATVCIRVAEEYAGKTVCIYSVDDHGKPVLEATEAVAEDATLTFDTDHCSLWFITDSEQLVEWAYPTISPWLWIGIGAVALLVVVVVITRLLRHKKLL